jgi:hypothetical protein
MGELAEKTKGATVRYWWREILGLLLVAMGLYLFYVIYVTFFVSGRYVEMVIGSIWGIIFFRGGLHLIKVALAARICADVPQQPSPSAKPRADNRDLAPGKTAPLGQT